MAVVEREPDGAKNYLAVYGGRKSEAEYMANLWIRVKARSQREREMMAADPFGRFILLMPPEQRDFLRELLQAEKSLRG